jgi:hypothetical protein
MSCAGIRDAIAKQNEASRIRAWVALLIGLLCCLAVLIVTIMVCFMIGFTGRWWLHIAVGIFAIFMIVSLIAMRAGVDPELDAGPITASDLTIAQWMRAIGGVHVIPRHTIAGFAGLIMHGPALLIEAAAISRHRSIPGDGETLASRRRDPALSHRTCQDHAALQGPAAGTDTHGQRTHTS